MKILWYCLRVSFFLHVGHLCMSCIDCLMQLSQNICPQWVVTRERPAAVNVRLLSRQIGQVMSRVSGEVGRGVAEYEGGVEGVVVGGGWGGAGEDTMMTSLSSSTPDMSIASSRWCLVLVLLVLFCVHIGEVRSTTATPSLSLASAVRSTTILLLSSSTMSRLHTEEPVEEEDTEMGRLVSSLKSLVLKLCRISFRKCPFVYI